MTLRLGPESYSQNESNDAGDGRGLPLAEHSALGLQRTFTSLLSFGSEVNSVCSLGETPFSYIYSQRTETSKGHGLCVVSRPVRFNVRSWRARPRLVCYPSPTQNSQQLPSLPLFYHTRNYTELSVF